MKQPTKREVIFHGALAEKYVQSVDIYADSLHTLCKILYLEVFPSLVSEQNVEMYLEDSDGNKTSLYHPDQVLLDDQRKIHILYNPEGNFELLTVIITILISVGISFLLAPKMYIDQDTTSGSNFGGIENVIGQGGVVPVALGTRAHGSRVVSHGIDSKLLTGRGA